jgi:hypothetical protein
VNASRTSLGLAAICVAVILLSIAGIAAGFVTRIELNIDGILLLLVCLTMGGLFSLMLFLLAKQEGWLPARRKKGTDGQQTTTGSQASPQEAK